VSAAATFDIAALERRRRLSLRAALIAVGVAIVGFPLGTSIGGSENRDTVAGAFLFAAIAGVVAAPWIVRAWTSFMRRRMLAAVVGQRADLSHLDGETQQVESREALSSGAFTLAAFRAAGLVEPFDSAGVHHILTGESGGVPFAIAEIALLDAKGFRLFGGVLASFRLARPRPGLTIVARDRGLLGNILARAGSTIERLTLEDPTFEGVFEAYGTDQVTGRVILTTTTLDRLKRLDEMAQARGFRCAFLEDHLMVVFPGMTWLCSWWWIVRPVGTWIDQYRAQLAGLIELPVTIVRTLNLDAPVNAAASPVQTALPGVPVGSGSGQVFSSPVFRLIGEGGLPLISVASGLLFGGVAGLGGWYGVKVGYSANLFWPFWTLIAAGLVYGAFAVISGVRQLLALAWRWNAPLRGLQRP
jgi:hypothetical protein